MGKMTQGRYQIDVGGVLQSMYTSKQACEIAGIDAHTLRSWLDELDIEPMIDPHDRRVRLLSEEQVDRLVEKSKRRRRASGVPSAETPLGGYIRSIKTFDRRIERMQDEIAAQAETVKELGTAKDELVRKGEELMKDIAQKNDEAIQRLERKVESSVQRFADLAAALEKLLRSRSDPDSEAAVLDLENASEEVRYEEGYANGGEMYFEGSGIAELVGAQMDWSEGERSGAQLAEPGRVVGNFRKYAASGH